MMTPTERARKGGQSTSAKKAATVRRNGAMPCAPGKKRGWKKGVPRRKPPVDPLAPSQTL